jgi:membrane-bound lytic murein transglycosylase D
MNSNNSITLPAHFILILLIMSVLSGCATVDNGRGQSSARRGDQQPRTTLPNSSHAEEQSFFIEEGPADISAVEVVQIPALPAEPEQTISQEIKELEDLGSWEEGTTVKAEHPQVTYDFPITINRQVEYYLDFFQNEHRKSFSRWLKRSTRYLPMIREELKKEGLPQDLAYLAMIESGFSQIAYSRARAMGMWQFIKGTGRKYNLKINMYVDERRHPVKATRAAIAYLSDLYEEFDSWYLAVAGYNAGEGKIRRAIKKYNTTNFWKLAQGNYLKLETKRYVPKLIAAIIIAKEPEKYGFTDIDYDQPLELETIKVPRWTALKAVARAGNMELKELQQLNRELKTQFTPPDSVSYELRVPAARYQMIAANLPRVHATVTTSYKTHTVRKGESLTSICRKYGLSKTVILKANRLSSASFKAGQRLRIPYRTTSYELLPVGEASRLIADASKDNLILHKVQPGETVSELSLRYNVPPHLIAGWNDLKDLSKIRAGQLLALYINDSPEPQQQTAAIKVPLIKPSVAKKSVSPAQKSIAATPRKSLQKTAGKVKETADVDGKFIVHHTVRKGDSLWRIAKRYGVDTESIKKWNELKNDLIRPGTKLLLKVARKPVVEERYYMVRGGDSLWTIARKHNLPLQKIKEWNNLKDDVIHPGRKLLLKIGHELGV